MRSFKKKENLLSDILHSFRPGCLITAATVVSLRDEVNTVQLKCQSFS